MKAIADFLQKVLLELAFPSTETVVKNWPPSLRRFGVGTQTVAAEHVASTSKVYDTPKVSFGEISDENVDDDDDDDIFAEEGAQAIGRENVSPIASPYKLPYLYNRHYLGLQYGIRIDGVSFKIGESTGVVDTDRGITIKGNEFRGTTGL